MTRRCLLIVLILSISFAAACKASKETAETPSPSPVPSASPAEDSETRIAREESKSQEWPGQDERPFDSSRKAVREAARQFVKFDLPKWTLKGMASQAFEANVFWVDVDLENGQQHRVLSLIVKQFFPESGTPYWKAFALDRNHASQLHYAHDAETQRQLEEASDKVSRYENGERP